MTPLEKIIPSERYTLNKIQTYEFLAKHQPALLVEIAERDPALFDQIAAAYYDKIVQELAMGQTP